MFGFVQTGALLQKLDRDTQKCAYKCCFAVINEKPVSTAGSRICPSPFFWQAQRRFLLCSKKFYPSPGRPRP